MISLKQLAAALYQQSKDKSETEIDNLIDNLLAILRAERLISKSDQLLAELDNLRLADQGKIAVTVRSRHSLSAAQKTKIDHYIKESTGLKAELVEKIDESIIGGLKLEFADSEVDITINKQLDDLRLHLAARSN